MKNKFYQLFLILVILFSISILQAQSLNEEYKNLVEVSPLFDIWIVQYAYSLTPKDQIIAGGVLHTPMVLGMIDYPGSIVSVTGELAYRRFLWKGLNVEFVTMPNYCWIHDDTDNSKTNGFGITGEIRAGYIFDFHLFNQPLTLNLQWFAGEQFITAKPKNFIDAEGGRSYISPVPVIFLGYRF